MRIRAGHLIKLAFVLLGCACAGLALPPGSQPSQAPTAASQSSVIAEIHADGSSRYTEAQIAAAAGLKPGDNVTRGDIQAAADRLTGLGVFSLVNYRFSSVGTKIRLDFQLKDAPQVPVAFDNFPWFTDAELAAAVREAAPLFDGNAPTDGAELDQISAAIAGLLKSHGLPDTFEHRLVAHPTHDGMMMQFHIEGPEITVDSLDFGDALARDSEKLRDRQQDLLRKPFSRFALDIFENEQIRPIYLSAGHLRVQFEAPVVRIVGAPSQPSSSKVSVALQIDPGPVYKLGIVDWKGATALSGETLVNLMVLKTGELADGMRLEAAWQRVAAEYAHRGYIEVKLDAQPEFDDVGGIVAYHVAVNEGPQYHMGDLVLTGLSLDAENHLRYSWKLPKGAGFDDTYYESMLAKLAMPNADIFGEVPVHYTELGHFLRVNPNTHTADVLLDFSK